MGAAYKWMRQLFSVHIHMAVTFTMSSVAFTMTVAFTMFMSVLAVLVMDVTFTAMAYELES